MTLGRLEVKQPIVWSARGMELLLEEGAADWQDIRVKNITGTSMSL